MPLILWWHMRHREPLEVPSTRLWRIVADGDRASRRLRRPPPSLALALQLLAAIALALAAAEPRFAVLERGPTVLVVDASVATSVLLDVDRDRHELALADLAGQLRAGDAPWSLWRVTDDAEPLLTAVRDAALVRRTLAGSRSTHLPSDWVAAAARVTARLPPRGHLIVVAADAAAADAAFAGVRERDGWTIEVVDIGGPFANWTVADFEVVASPGRVGRWEVSALIRGSPATEAAPPTHVVWGFLPDGSSAILELDPDELHFNRGGTASASAIVDAVTPGVLSARLVPGDAFAGDDIAVVRIEPRPAGPRVALLGDAAEPVARALRALGAETVEDAAAAEVVVVAGGTRHGTIAAPAVLWIGGAEGIADPGSLVRRDPAAATWDADHPLTAATAWDRLEASAALDLPLPADAEIVVHGIGGPLVAARTTAERREVWLAFGAEDARWTGTAAFVSLMGDALAWLAPERHITSGCVVGAPCAVPRAVAVGAGEVRHDGAVVARWPDPAGSFTAAPERAWRPERAGASSWHVGAATGWLASDLSGAARAEVSAAGTRARAPATGTPPAAPWRDLRPSLLAATALLLLEGLIAAGGREPLWRPSSWAAVGVVAARRRAAAVWHALAVALLLAAVAATPWPLAWITRVLVVVGDGEVAGAWRASQVRRVAAEDADGFVDVEAALAAAWAVAAGEADVRLLWATGTPITRGSLERALVRPGAGRGAIDVAPPAERPPGDVAVARVATDRPPFAGDVVQLSAIVVAQAATSASLAVWRDDALLIRTSVDLPAGASQIRLPVPTPEAGTERWRVTVDATSDEFRGNDAAERLVVVRPAPSVWVVTSEEERGAAFVEALVVQGYRATLRPPFRLPITTSGYAGADAVVLANVAALEMSTLQQEVLEAWVRDHGGGLTITGGERAFGPGGYIETTLDRLAPVSSNIPREAPEVALLFVLDRSGSMQQSVRGVTRLDIAKEAAVRATEMLGPASQVAIVVFDEVAQVLLPWTPTSDLYTVAASLARVVPGGGTAMYPGLVLARDLLREMDAATRHVVVMTDGLSQPGDFAGITADIVALQATVSTVAIGQGSDVERVREIARLGGGKAHVTADVQALPGILAQEALLLSVDPIVREVVTPRSTGVNPGLMAGMPARFPPIVTFVETTPKLDADVAIVDDEGRPLLVAWRYGAGRVLAFTAHAVGPWVEAWTATEAFPRWWGQWVRWTVQPTPVAGLALDTRVSGDALALTVTATDTDGGMRRGLDLEAWVRPANGAATTARRLAEVGPGTYAVTVPLPLGDATAEVVDRAGALDPVTVAVTHTYPAAWSGVVPDRAPAIAAWTGGLVIAEARSSVGPGGRWVWSWTPRWRPWLAAAAAAWLVSLTLRYAPGWTRPLRRRRVSSRAARATPAATGRPSGR